MFSTTKQCSCKLIFQLQHKLKQVSKHASRACSLKVKQVLSDPLEDRKYEHENEQYDETDSEITFRLKDLTTKLCDPDQLRTKPDVTDLKFGHIFTDHMMKVFYHKKLGGWQKPVVIPFENISLHPAAKVLHYAVELFEGMKAYRGIDGKIRIFRPDLNMIRMNQSAISSGLPTFDSIEMIKCMKRLLEVDQEWVPHSESSSLYLRPTLIGIDGTLGVQQSDSALLYTIMCPVGSYFEGDNDSVSLLADPAYTRAWPGGCGDKKLGSNYGPTIRVQSKANQRGRQQVLWLYGPEHQITEVGTMNIFVFYKDEYGNKVLATPPLNGLILPGVTRQSILQLCQQWEEFRIEQRVITMNDIIQLEKAGRVALVFGMFGACRREELVNVKVQDIRREGNMLIISIPDTKNKKPRSFGINGDFVKMVEDYAALRPAKANTERFFLNYQKGSCTIQPIGKNKFGSMPKIIAEWLKLPDPALYTGHSFRRTAATLLSNAGGDLIAVKQLGGWESDRVAQSYIEESSKSKRKIGELITSDITLASTSKETSIDHLYKKPKGQNNMNNNGNGTNNLAVCNSQTITKTVFGNKGSPRINIQNCQNLLEMFGSGTACIVSPINSIEFKDQMIYIPTTQHQNPIYRRVREDLRAIQYGHIEHPWADPID